MQHNLLSHLAEKWWLPCTLTLQLVQQSPHHLAHLEVIVYTPMFSLLAVNACLTSAHISQSIHQQARSLESSPQPPGCKLAVHKNLHPSKNWFFCIFRKIKNNQWKKLDVNWLPTACHSHKKLDVQAFRRSWEFAFIEKLNFSEKYGKLRRKIRQALTSHHMPFACKIRNSCLLWMLRNYVDKKSSTQPISPIWRIKALALSMHHHYHCHHQQHLLCYMLAIPQTILAPHKHGQFK